MTGYVIMPIIKRWTTYKSLGNYQMTDGCRTCK